MSDKSSIEWLDGGSTWNPMRARITDEEGKVRVGWHCEHASIGCIGCYSEQTNKGFFQLGTKVPYTRASRDKVEIFLDEKALLQPLRWRQGRKIFPCSMTDWAADFVFDEWMDKMLAIAALCPQHEFLFLTKRAQRLPDYLYRIANCDTYLRDAAIAIGQDPRTVFLAGRSGGQLSNVTLGFSAENQEWFDKRWPHMRKVAEAGWKVNCSYEPALGPINFGDALPLLSQVIFGGHSGPNAKPCDVQWARDTIAQCKAAGTACFVKQFGAEPGFISGSLDRQGKPLTTLTRIYLKDKKGSDPSEWEPTLRVRQYPSR